MRLALTAALALALVAGATAASADGKAKKPKKKKAKLAEVTLAWDEEEFPATMQVYEPKAGEPPALWTTASVKTRKELPVGEELEDGTFELLPGGVKRLVLVVENKTKADLFFFAAPHGVEPAKLSLGFDFRCLCMNHAYHVPAGAIWYRVVELRLDPGFPAKAVEVKHALATVSKARAAEIQNPAVVVVPPKT